MRLLEAESGGLRRAVDEALPRRWAALLAAEDVLQQTYTDAFVGIQGFVPVGDGAFGSWLRSMARNNVRDAVRALEADKRGGGLRPLGAQDLATSAAGLLDRLGAGTQTSPSAHLARSEAAAAVLAAVDGLPAVYSLVIRRMDLEGAGAAAVARELGRSAGAVHLLRQRALARLRVELHGAWETSGDSA